MDCPPSFVANHGGGFWLGVSKRKGDSPFMEHGTVSKRKGVRPVIEFVSDPVIYVTTDYS